LFRRKEIGAQQQRFRRVLAIAGGGVVQQWLDTVRLGVVEVERGLVELQQVHAGLPIVLPMLMLVVS
jgi:hypothetical protein